MAGAVFLRVLLADPQRTGILVRDLRDATEALWSEASVQRGGKALERAMREVDERTKGQPFRLDTMEGPLFLDVPLWRFAGCPGVWIEDDVDRPRKRRPTWDGDWRAAAAREVA